MHLLNKANLNLNTGGFGSLQGLNYDGSKQITRPARPEHIEQETGQASAVARNTRRSWFAPCDGCDARWLTFTGNVIVIFGFKTL